MKNMFEIWTSTATLFFRLTKLARIVGVKMVFFGRNIRIFFSFLKRNGSGRHPLFRLRRCTVTATVLLTLFVMQGCTREGNSESKIVMRVGTTKISLAEAKNDFHRLLSELPDGEKQQESMKQQILSHLIDQYLILDYGKENHISVSDEDLEHAVNSVRNDFSEEGFNEAILHDYIDIDQWKKQLRKKLLEERIIQRLTATLSPPDHVAILHYYENHADAFATKRQVKFRQIVTNDLQKAKKILQQLDKGERFEAVARQESLAPEAKNGGLVGWMEQGELEKTMDKTLFSLKPGQISQITHSPYGYHIFQVLASRPAGVRPLPEVTNQIENELSRAQHQAFLAEWLKKQKKRVKVHVDTNIFQMLEQ